MTVRGTGEVSSQKDQLWEDLVFGLFLKCCETWKECLSVCKSACGCVWERERVSVSVILSEKERERANGVDLMARSNKIHSQLPLLPDFQRSWPPPPPPRPSPCWRHRSQSSSPIKTFQVQDFVRGRLLHLDVVVLKSQAGCLWVSFFT